MCPVLKWKLCGNLTFFEEETKNSDGFTVGPDNIIALFLPSWFCDSMNIPVFVYWSSHMFKVKDLVHLLFWDFLTWLQLYLKDEFWNVFQSAESCSQIFLLLSRKIQLLSVEHNLLAVPGYCLLTQWI